MSVGKHDRWEPIDLSGGEHSGSADLLPVFAKVSLCTEAYGRPVSRTRKPWWYDLPPMSISPLDVSMDLFVDAFTPDREVRESEIPLYDQKSGRRSWRVSE